ncbi:MAG TPA: polysaccharide deacetylase family protein [Solirubrobacteraceae bacterium]|nr:polysaccharide deacetylase family protein [Solirubrobacteraceae bacterium]
MRDSNLVVMYHYVRPENSDGVTGLTPEKFGRQLDLVGKHYRFVTLEEYLAQHEDESGMALVTFDDAVSDQYDYAFPVLEAHDVPAVVFAPMRPFSEETDRWSTQHLLHALAQHLGWAEFERRVDAILGPLDLDQAAVDRIYHYEVPAKRRMKYTLAFAVKQPQVREVLCEINRSVGLDAADWFVSAAQLREIQAAGHAIGGHGFDHVPYDTLTPKQQAADMHRAQAVMTEVCGAMQRALAYPYGSSAPETEGIAKGCGYSMCFDTAGRVDAMNLERELGS